MHVDTWTRGGHDGAMVGEVLQTGPHGRTDSTQPREGPGRRLGRRTGLGVVIVIALAFTAASADQIVAGAFESSVRPLPDAPPGSSDHRCADGVRALALESSPIGHANTLESPEAGSTPLDSAAVGEACSHSSAGLDAWASLLRLEEAERQLPAGSRVELATLRRNVFAHLPAELR